MKDALGKELVMGQLYGYSNTQNGITVAKAGHLEKIGEKLVTLRVVYAGWAAYNNDMETDKSFKKSAVSTKSNMLFPIQSI